VSAVSLRLRRAIKSLIDACFFFALIRDTVCFFADFTDGEERSSDAEDGDGDEDEYEDTDAAEVVYKKDEHVRGESDDDDDDSEPEPEVELQPWFVPEGYKACTYIRAHARNFFSLLLLI
jgi:hypothetical protein